MGQVLNPEIIEAIMEYLQFGYGTPKKLFKEIYPIFRNRYSEDTFRRLLHRNLKRLKDANLIIEHPLRPFYCLPDNEWILNFDLVLAVRRRNFQFLERETQIISATRTFGKSEYTFAEYFLEQRKETP